MPASLEARGIVLVLLVVAAVGVPGVLAHWVLSRQQEDRYASSAEAFLAVALGTYLRDAAGAGVDVEDWLEQLAQQSARVRWAGVFDENGAGLEFRRRTNLRREEILAQIPFDVDKPAWRPLLVRGISSQQFYLLTVPQADHGATLAAVIDLGTSGSAAPLVLAGLAGAGLAGLATALAWFRFAIQRPLQQLDRWGAALHQGLSEVALGHLPPEELRNLVRSMEETQRELQKWRGEAGYLRHSVDVQVDAKTRNAARALQQAEHAADTDPLTKLGNRRALERDFPRLFGRQQAEGRELTAVLFDIDHFKTLNDALGHQAGDELLALLGGLLRAVIRKRTDLAVRVGGDEFLLLLSDTSALEGVAVARRVRELFVQQTRTFSGVDPLPGLSAGVAACRQHGARSWQGLLELADAAMYDAKQRGLGVVTAGDTARVKP